MRLRMSSVALGGLVREVFDFRRDYGKSLAGIAGSRGLDGGIQRQQIGLFGNGLDLLHDVPDSSRGVREAVHLGGGIGHGPGDAFHGGHGLIRLYLGLAGMSLGLCGIVGRGFGTEGDAAHGGHHFFGGGGDSLAAVIHFAHLAHHFGAAGDGFIHRYGKANDLLHMPLVAFLQKVGHGLDFAGDGAGSIRNGQVAAVQKQIKTLFNERGVFSSRPAVAVQRPYCPYYLNGLSYCVPSVLMYYIFCIIVRILIRSIQFHQANSIRQGKRAKAFLLPP